MSGSASFKVKTKWIRWGCDISFQGKISFKSSQDQLRIECEARAEHKVRVELWSSLLVGGIAVSLIITRAMLGTSAS